MDLLADVLELSGVRGTIGALIEAGGSWSVPAAGCTTAVLHVVTAGSAWVGLDGQWRELAAGDVLLLPGGPPHVLSSEPGTATAPARPGEKTARPGEKAAGPEEKAAGPGKKAAGPGEEAVLAGPGATAFGAGQTIRLGASPARTRVLTVGYDCDRTVRTQVLGALPGAVHIRADQAEAGFNDTVRMLGRELGHPRLAGRAVLNSLVDILLVQLMRVWLPTQPGQRGTWLGGLGDPLVHGAMERLHAEPARPWTTTALASALGVSRATLTRRFPAAVGQSPAAYLTQWRMDLAAVRLRRGREPVESVAAAVGYLSVPAFSRAFTRSHGMSPGRYRAAQPA